MTGELEGVLLPIAGRIVGDAARIEGLQRLSGGASMETWAFAAVGRQGRRELILRRRPGGAGELGSSAVPLATEAALIGAAEAAGVPVPPVLHVCVEADGLGEAYVMGRVEGETLGRRIVRDEKFAAVRPRLARQCGEILARLHAAEPPKVELGTKDALGELAHYEEIYRASGARRPVMELGFRHLKAHAPEPGPSVLLHGDFRNGNLMFDPEAGVTAVLDWELAHIGDPAEDLAWICVNSWRFGGNDKPVGGFGDYSDLLAGYVEAGGAPVPLDRLLYWQTLGSLKWGVMCLIMYRSFADGGPSASVERAMIGRRVSETEIDVLNLLEASR